MDSLEDIVGVDIYLLDQVLKGRIQSGQRLLDAGCGSGRNLRFLVKLGCDCTGIDHSEEHINNLTNEFNEKRVSLVKSSIENYSDSEKFDVVVCNAVLHFANNHGHFDSLFDKLNDLLRPGGLLFIRMTSDIGLQFSNSDSGVHLLPDGSQRYLITREKISSLCVQYNLKLAEPVKTVNVDGLRCMSTLVFYRE